MVVGCPGVVVDEVFFEEEEVSEGESAVFPVLYVVEQAGFFDKRVELVYYAEYKVEDFAFEVCHFDGVAVAFEEVGRLSDDDGKVIFTF